jgi:membrane fusion protein (multidrug efflux system)
MLRNTGILVILIIIALTAAMSAVRDDAHKADSSNAENKPVVEVITLKKASLEKTIRLPGDLLPYEAVDIYAKESGFIETLRADRGSEVKKDDVLAQLVAPELDKRLEEARAQYLAVNDQYQRRRKLRAGVVSVESVELLQNNTESARENMEALREQQNYLTIRAPFDGVITSRNLHTGALVIAGGNNGAVRIFRLEKIDTLRLTVAVPEAQVEGVKEGTEVAFTVPALPDRKFAAKISRFSHSLDQITRTEAVELDVDNASRILSPGMYADIIWPVTRVGGGFTVPVKAVATTTEKTFVIRVKGGITEWVEVKRGNASGDMVEVFGALQEGDSIVTRATDELREGIKVMAQAAAAPTK